MTAFINHTPVIAAYVGLAALMIAVLVRFPIMWLVVLVLGILFEGD